VSSTIRGSLGNVGNLLNVFERFCDDLPETVREDLQFMLVILSDGDLVVDELGDINERARALFGRKPSLAELVI
jgi:hypothetical protein